MEPFNLTTPHYFEILDAYNEDTNILFSNNFLFKTVEMINNL